MTSSAELSEIQHFFKNKSILLTGVTSTVGKLLLERIFRLLAVKRIYVLVRDKDGVVAETRCALTLDSLVRKFRNLFLNYVTMRV